MKTPIPREPQENDKEAEESVINEIVGLIKKAAGDVVVVVDACAIRHGVKDELKELLDKTGFPVYAAPMGKTAVNENYERYGGVSSVLIWCQLINLFAFVDICWVLECSGNKGESRVG